MAKESGNSSGEVMIRRQRVGRRTGSLECGSGSGGLGQCFKKVCSRSYGKREISFRSRLGNIPFLFQLSIVSDIARLSR